jgi:chaperone required for assembly of F1-ATPase
LVYRVLDIVFAEGIEAIFRFSLALLHKSEEQLVDLEFEGILNFLQTDLFEVYRAETSPEEEQRAEGEWLANDFVRDAYDVRM